MDELMDALCEMAAEADLYGRAGDMLAEMLGYAVAAIEAGEEFDDEQMQGGRDAIVIWHRMRAGER